MIPKQLKTTLLEKQEVKDLLASHHIRDKFNKGFREALALKIVDAVEKNIILDENLQGKVRQKQSSKGSSTSIISIDARTLDRMLNDEKYKCSLKSYQCILVYLGIPQNHWKSYLDWSKEITHEHHYLGAYHLYRYNLSRNKQNIVRTVIRLMSGDGPKMKVEYFSLDKKIFEGDAFLKDKILTITIHAEKSIEITAGIPPKDIAPGNLLHAIIRSSRNGMPYTKNAIMVFQGEGMLNSDSNTITTIYHTSVFKDKEFQPVRPYESNGDIDPIPEFLARKMKELNANPFNRATLDEVISRNTKAHQKEKPEFSTIEPVLRQGHWYSISSHQPIRGFVCISHFKFDIDDVTKECLFECTRHEEEGEIIIHGYVEYFKKQYVFKMSRKNMYDYLENKILMYSIGKHCQDDLIRASTTLFLHRKDLNLNVKEIFFKTDEPLKITKIPYQTFLDSELISNFDKHIVLSNDQFQKWSDLELERINKFNHLENFADDWFAYIPNAYSENDRSLLQLTISIDKIGFTKENIVFKKPGRHKHITAAYAGTAEIYNDKKLLRLINRTEHDQVSGYIFDIEKKDDEDAILQGVTLDNDMHDAACADYVILLRKSALVVFEASRKPTVETSEMVSGVFLPQILEPGAYHYDLVSNYLTEEAHIDINDLFFNKFKSIRKEKP